MKLGANSNVVLAFVGQIHGDRGLQSIPLDLLQRHSVPAASRTRFPQASTLLLPNPDFCHAAGALGFGTAPDPAPDGVVRHAYLLLEYQGRLLPSLPFALFLAHHAIALDEIDVREEGVVRIPLEAGRVVAIPLDERGCFRIDYAASSTSFPTYDYRDIYAALSGDRADFELAEGKTFIIGRTDTTIGDLHATPREPAAYGVFVLASTLDTMLRGSFRVGVTPWLLAAFALASSLLGALGGAGTRGWGWIVTAVAITATPLLASWVGFRAGWVVPPSAIAVAGLLALLVATGLAQARQVSARRRLESVFRQFLPAETHARLLDGTETLGATQRVFSVLLAGAFHGIGSARLSAEEEVELLRDLLDLVGESVHGSRGALMRVSPSGFLALFGHPVALSDPTRDGARRRQGSTRPRARPEHTMGRADVGAHRAIRGGSRGNDHGGGHRVARSPGVRCVRPPGPPGRGTPRLRRAGPSSDFRARTGGSPRGGPVRARGPNRVGRRRLLPPRRLTCGDAPRSGTGYGGYGAGYGAAFVCCMFRALVEVPCAALG